jgi:hypothetical protein
MPDTPKATFSELISIEFSTKEFGDSIGKLISMWQSATEKMSAATSPISKLVDSIGTLQKKIGDQVDKASRDSARAAETHALKIGAAKESEVIATQKAEAAKTQLESAQNVLRTRQERFASAEKVKAAESVVAAAAKLEALRTQIAETYAKLRVGVEQGANNQLLINYRTTIRRLETEARAGSTQLNAALRNQAKLDAAGSSGYFASLAKNLSSSVAFGTKLYLGMLATQAAMAALTAPGRIFVDTLKSGWQHINEMQLAAEQLQGSLLESTKFSKDVDENFMKSAQAARFAANEFHEFSAKGGVSAELLGKAFNSLLVSGGGAGLKTVSEATKLVEGLAVSITKISGQNAGRALLSEVPKLMSGTLADSSKLLKIMGMTSAEARNLVAEGIRHQDLLQRLEPLFRPYLAVVETADSRMSRLNAQLKVMKDAIAESVARPIWQAWLEILQRVKQFYDQHKEGLLAIGSEFGKLIVQLGKLGEATVTSFGGLQGILGLLMSLVARLGSVLTMASAMRASLSSFEAPSRNAKEQSAFSKVLHGPEEKAIEASYQERVRQARGQWLKDRQELSDRYDKQFAAFDNALRVANNMQTQSFDEFVKGLKEDAANQRAVEVTQLEGQRHVLGQQLALQLAIDGSIGSQSEKTKKLSAQLSEVLTKLQTYKKADNENAGNLPLGGNSNAPLPAGEIATDKLKALKAALKEELDSVRNVQSEIRNEYENSARTGDISQRTATDGIIASLLREQKAVKKLGDKYINLARDIRALKVEGLRGFISDVNAAVGKTVTADQNAARTAQAQYSKEAYDTQTKIDRELEQSAIEHRRYMVSVIQDEAEQGITTRTEAVDKERDLLTAEHNYKIDLLNDEVAQAGANEFKLAEINNRKIIEAQRYSDALEATAAKRRKIYQDELDFATRSAAADQAFYAAQAHETVNAKIESGRIPAGGFSDIAELQALAKELESAQEASALALQAFSNALNTGTQINSEKGQQLWRAYQEASSAVHRVANEMESVAARNPFVRFAVAIDEAIRRLQTAATPLEKLDAVMQMITASAQNLKNIIGAIAQGGVAGTLSGIGGALGQFGKNGVFGQNGALSGIGKALGGFGKALPVVGGVMEAAGAIFSLFGDMFTKRAKQIAAQIQKDLDGIMRSYNAGATNLVNTIAALEAKRAEAIASLSGQKGGKDQLDKLLPSIDDQLTSLRKQQQEIKDTFNASLANLRLHSDTLAGMADQWREINKQVRDYIGAGGDARKAAEYLTLSLQKMKKEAQDNINQGTQDAIQDALQLNDLLQQRIKLTEDWKKTEFDLLTADALERRQAGAVTRGRELVEQRKEYQKQLDDLNSQITLTQKKVAMEQAVYHLNLDVAALHRLDEKLTLAALDEQLKKIKDMQKFLSANAAGKLNSALGFGATTVNNFASGAFVINGNQINNDPAINRAANDLRTAIQRRRRVGY